VRRTRALLTLTALLFLTLVSGCGGCGRERDKNKDYDRPKDYGRSTGQKW